MNKEKIIITGYENPDLDNIASAYAYREYLGLKNIKAEIGIFGIPHPEAQFLMDYLGIKLKKIGRILKSKDKIILVDCSEPGWIYPKIKNSQVVEVYDHRAVNRSEDFKKAKKQIELVGACATLIAEKFCEDKIKPSKETAILIYTAIISNTINFQANVTTSRDKKVAQWLKRREKISKNLIHQMFAHKSELKGSVDKILLKDLAVNQFGGKKFTIFQLEIINVAKFVKNYLAKIKKTLIKAKNKENFDFVFLTCVDLEKGKNTFVAADEESQKVVSETLKVKFKNGIANYREVIMRKEIMPKLKEYLEK